MKKIKIILSIILMALMIIKILSSCSFAYTTNQLDDLIDNWYENKDNGEWANPQIMQRLWNVRQTFPNEWQYFWETYQGGSLNFTDAIHVSLTNNDYTQGFTLTAHWLTKDSFTINNDNIRGYCHYHRWIYNGSTHSYTLDVTSQNYLMDLWKGTCLLINSQNWSSQLKSAFINDKKTFNTMYQWVYFARKGGSQTLYTNGNETINAFTMRIGQKWNLTDTTINLYYMNGNTKTYINNVEMVFNNIETNVWHVSLETENLLPDETYYLEMIYNGITWINSKGQRIVKGYGQNPSYSGDNTDIIIDLDQVHQDLQEINGNIEAQTYAILSGDWKILEQLKEIESGEQARFDYWVGFFNPSGDNSGLVLNESGDIFGIRYQNIDNFGIFDFLSTTFNSLYNLLFNNTDNVSLSMGQFGTLNSADFVINNNTLNGFLYFTINPTLILITIFFYYRFIKMVATINLKVFDSYDIDSNIKLF